MTELLYEKQSLLERMAAERSAQQLAWEQQLSGLRDDAERVKRYQHLQTVPIPLPIVH